MGERLDFPAGRFYPWYEAILSALSASHRYADIVEEAAPFVDKTWGTIEPDLLPPDFPPRLQVADEEIRVRLEDAAAFGALE